MTKLIIPVLLLICTNLTGQSWNCGDILVDERDGQAYKTVQIDNLCWMAESLNIGEILDSISMPENNNTIEKHCYSDNPENCDIYGGLYNWHEAMNYNLYDDNQGICPSGWEVPHYFNYWDLIDYLVGSNSGGKLKDTSDLWLPPNAGATNESGFTGLPGG